MRWSIYRDGALIERGDDDTRTVYGPTGSKVRDYTQAENQTADDAITAAVPALWAKV